MPINRANVRKLVQDFNFRTLFVEEMGWSSVPNARPVPLDVEGSHLMRRLIAQMSGVSVFEVFSADTTRKIPDARTRAAIHKQIEGLSHENLLIFLDSDQERTQSLWYWVKREGKKKQPREHLYLKGQPGDLFLSKLDGLVIELDELREDGTIPITEVTSRLAESLDVERVTKKFYNEFSTLRVDFVDMIEGIDREPDRFWYASVLLNRLMFIYFLQKRGFIQNNTHYLDYKLEESQRRGEDRYFSEFLGTLFFEGFAKPENQRSAEAKALLGAIRYLNGGLFIPHMLELKYPDIHIPDKAFENVLDLFGRYSWHLDDTPGADDDEINPDVLGYIFEKYINQKAFGAYYTRPEITHYLCERTIHAVILERIHQNSPRQFSDLNEVLVKLDADLCRLLLNVVLPKISILDPACGSGAFLVAAMKTLLDIYAAVFGKIDFLNDRNLTEQLKEIRWTHPSINYYVRKRIITDNLYGVDIMEEAAEIAKLRLFLVLVSSAQSIDELEPLPNIDFNIMCGNSLVGLLTVDEERFAQKEKGFAQMELFQEGKAHQYRELLADKNRLIGTYRYASTLTDNLESLRSTIEDHEREAYQNLNEILLDDFGAFGIQYEQAQSTGRVKKRPMKIEDIEQLTPFHWGYEFDEIIGVRGGFDVIITNPPWEIFKPNSREFFAEYSDLINKKEMDIKAFEKEQGRLLEDFEIEAAWLDYLSRYPHVSAYYRSASQYKNQISIVNERKTGSDINLYKLFTEQCFNLLRHGGTCGIVIPSGIYTDLGTKQLREMLFTETHVGSLFGLSNERFIFEGVDHRFKICLLVFIKGNSTEFFDAAFRINPREAVSVVQLDRFLNSQSEHIKLSVPFIRRASPDSLSVLEFRDELDVTIAEKMLNSPLLGDDIPDTWNIKLGREFDMTNDSSLFRTEPSTGRLPLYEGKMIWQFEHNLDKSMPRYWVDEIEARQAVIGRRGEDNDQLLDYQKCRLAFRSVASSTNARTLVATVIPCAFTGNSLIVSSSLDNVENFYVVSVLNSYVIDWLLRQRVSTNINMFYVYQLPVPRLMMGEVFFDALAERAAKLICTAPEFDELAREIGLGSHNAGVTDKVERNRLRAELDGMIAHIYGLTEEEFTHILASFPLVPEPVKVAALNAYKDVERGQIT